MSALPLQMKIFYIDNETGGEKAETMEEKYIG